MGRGQGGHGNDRRAYLCCTLPEVKITVREGKLAGKVNRGNEWVWFTKTRGDDNDDGHLEADIEGEDEGEGFIIKEEMIDTGEALRFGLPPESKVI